MEKEDLIEYVKTMTKVMKNKDKEESQMMFHVEYEIPRIEKRIKGKQGQKEFFVEGLIAHPDNEVEVISFDYGELWGGEEIEKVEDGKVIIANPLTFDREVKIIAHGVPKFMPISIYIVFGHGEELTLITTPKKAEEIINKIKEGKKFTMTIGENRHVFINSEFVQHFVAYPTNKEEYPNAEEHLKKWDALAFPY